MEKSLPDDLYDQLDGEPLDLLDQHKTRLLLRSTDHRKRKADESDDEPEIDSEGRLIITEDGSKRIEKPSKSESRSEAGSHMPDSHSKKLQKRQKASQSGWAYTGKEYTSKKARGDLTRKGKFEPYAYWPLDRKMMSRRPEHRAAARKGIANVVKVTKKLEGKSVSKALSMETDKALGK